MPRRTQADIIREHLTDPEVLTELMNNALETGSIELISQVFRDINEARGMTLPTTRAEISRLLDSYSSNDMRLGFLLVKPASVRTAIQRS